MKRVLICSDGSAYSQVCYEYASWLAARTPCSFEVLYVTDLRQFEVPMIADLSGSLGVQPYQAIMGKLQELEQEKSRVVLQEAARFFADKAPKVPLKTSHRTGFLVDCMSDFETTADLVMLGKRGENANFATEHLGSTMERVVRASKRPCFVTSRSFRPIERVLLAYDGGKSGRKALEFLERDGALKGLELHVVIVAAREGEEIALGYLRDAEMRLTQAGYKPVCQMLHGIPEDEIADYIETKAINLILMGAYGHSRIRHLVIGSTTAEMMRQCRVPVILFR